MKTAGKVFLILFWAVIWAVTALPYLIVAALFYVFDLVFWKLEGILQHCIDEAKRLGGECGWLEGEDEEVDGECEVDIEDNEDVKLKLSLAQKALAEYQEARRQQQVEREEGENNDNG